MHKDHEGSESKYASSIPAPQHDERGFQLAVKSALMVFLVILLTS
jgi:hypothetical protein